MLLALPALIESGLLSFLDVFRFSEGYYSLKSILMTLSFCFLLRVKSVEKISSESPGELGKVIGLDRIPEVKTLRNKMDDLSKEGQSKQWLRQLSRFWMVTAPGLAGILYIDGHESPYFGKNNKLPRRYISRLKLAHRGTTDYWVCDCLGQPFFSISKSISGSMIEVIKTDIIPRLKQDVPGQPTEQELALDKYLHKFMVVYDREGYSNDFILDMWDERISVCTYNKYVKDKWDVAEFREHEIQKEGGGTETIKLAERLVFIQGKESEKLSSPVPFVKFVQTGQGTQVKVGKKHTKKTRGMWIREIRKLKKNGHQTSILTTNYKLSIILIGQYMFARWCQENFFKYMMENFGIDFLISYFKENIDDTAELVNPQWRILDKKVRSANTKLQKLRARFGEITLKDEISEDKVKAYQEKKSQLYEDIVICQDEVNELKTQRSQIHKKIKFSELEEDEKFKAVYNQRKHFIDTIKLTTYRGETSLANTIKQFMAKPAEARSLLRQIFSSDADFHIDRDKKTIEVTIHHLSTKRDNIALRKLCKELNQTETIFPDTDLTLVYKTVSG